MAQVAIDAPDYQRGVISAQKLLATVPAGTASVTVGIPPNAETLIVTAADMADGGTIYVQGTSTLYKYPGLRLPSQPHMTAALTWVFDISNSMDEQVNVVFTDAPGMIWFVYADSTAHVIADASTLKNTRGSMYVVPAVPSTAAGDHPVDELQCAVNGFGVNSTFIYSPGAGQRLRVFTLALANTTTTLTSQFIDSVTGGLLGFLQGVGPLVLPLPGQGYPLSADAALEVQLGSGGGVVVATAYYTVETV
jgi:hypothetical protein